MRTHGVDHAAHLLWCALTVGIDRPEEEFLQTKIPGEIGECPLACDQPALVFRQGRQRIADWLHGRLDLVRIGLGIGGVDIGMGRVDLCKTLADILYVDQGVIGRHPGMGIGFSLVGPAADRHRFHALAHRHIGNAGEVGQKLLKPQFQIEPIAQDQVRLAGLENIARRGLVVVNFGARLGDALHVRRPARHIARHIGDDGEGRHDHGFFFGKRHARDEKRKRENGMPDFMEVHGAHQILLQLIRNTIGHKVILVNAIANHSQFRRFWACPKMTRFCAGLASGIKLFSMRKRHYRKARTAWSEACPACVPHPSSHVVGRGRKTGYLMSGCCG
ncbi:Cobalamin Biosynthesis Protein CobN [Agrobacterium tumefaciens]|nr:Cobalamin Biosynthesis Protein CobN [Agrobacterium tumefaciens]